MMQDIFQALNQWISDPLLIGIFEALTGIIILTIIFRLIARFLPRRVQDKDLRYRIRKSINLFGYAMTAIYVATVFNSSLGQITVIFGAVGAGIAFALQEVIVSFAGWVAISLGQFYKVGDRVQLGGIKGDIIDVSLLRTTLMECGDWVTADLYNGRIVRVANSFVFKEPVFNYSGDFPFLWDEIKLPIRYGSDYRLTKEILLRVAQAVTGQYIPQAEEVWNKLVHKYRIEDAKVTPVVTLIANDNWAEFTLRYVVDYKFRRITKDQLFTSILEEIDQTEGRIKLASSTVELVSDSGIQVQLQNSSAL